MMNSSTVKDVLSSELTVGKEKQIPQDNDKILSEATQKLSIICDKTNIPKENDTVLSETLRCVIAEKTHMAAMLLMRGDFLNAFIEIDNALELHPNNDMALTIRGKTYLALAGGKKTRKVRYAFIDFEEAIRLNKYNVEAGEFRDAILMRSRLSYIKKNMPETVKEIDDHLGNRELSENTKVFLKNIKFKIF